MNFFVHCNSWFSYFAMWSLFNIVFKSINFIWKTMLQLKCKFFICIERNCNSAFYFIFRKNLVDFDYISFIKGVKKTTIFFRSNYFASTNTFHNYSICISGVIVIGKHRSFFNTLHIFLKHTVFLICWIFFTYIYLIFNANYEL